jgi:hypothetical protein
MQTLTYSRRLFYPLTYTTLNFQRTKFSIPELFTSFSISPYRLYIDPI